MSYALVQCKCGREWEIDQPGISALMECPNCSSRFFVVVGNGRVTVTFVHGGDEAAASGPPKSGGPSAGWVILGENSDQDQCENTSKGK